MVIEGSCVMMCVGAGGVGGGARQGGGKAKVLLEGAHQQTA